MDGAACRPELKELLGNQVRKEYRAACRSDLTNLLAAYGCASTNAGWRRLAIFLAFEADKLAFPPAPKGGGRVPNLHVGTLMEACLAGQRRQGQQENISQAARDTLSFLKDWDAADVASGLSDRAEVLPTWQSIRRLHYAWEKGLAAHLGDTAEGALRAAGCYSQEFLEAWTEDAHFAQLEHEAASFEECEKAA